MKKPNGTDSIGHPGDLLLPYLEDRLSGKDRAMIQEHINTCKECSHEIQMLERLMAKLKANKDVFCPEPHLLFDFAETGEDPEGKLARHVVRCPLCQENVAAYRAGCEVAVLPEKVQAAYKERFSQFSSRQSDVPRRSLFADLTDWLAALFKVPAFVLATAAAAILVVVLIYPRGEIEPYIGLSSVTWKQTEDDFAPKSLQVPEKKPRVAVVLLFKGFKEQLPQEKIDSLYKDLNPPEEAFERFDFLMPANVQAALKGKTDARDEAQAQSQIVGQVDADTAMIIEVISKKSAFEIDGRAIDAKSGKTIDRQSREHVSEAQLASELPKVLAALLGSRLSIR